MGRILDSGYNGYVSLLPNKSETDKQYPLFDARGDIDESVTVFASVESEAGKDTDYSLLLEWNGGRAEIDLLHGMSFTLSASFLRMAVKVPTIVQVVIPDPNPITRYGHVSNGNAGSTSVIINSFGVIVDGSFVSSTLADDVLLAFMHFVKAGSDTGQIIVPDGFSLVRRDHNTIVGAKSAGAAIYAKRSNGTELATLTFSLSGMSGPGRFYVNMVGLRGINPAINPALFPSSGRVGLEGFGLDMTAPSITFPAASSPLMAVYIADKASGLSSIPSGMASIVRYSQTISSQPVTYCFAERNDTNPAAGMTDATSPTGDYVSTMGAGGGNWIAQMVALTSPPADDPSAGQPISNIRVGASLCYGIRPASSPPQRTIRIRGLITHDQIVYVEIPTFARAVCPVVKTDSGQWSNFVVCQCNNAVNEVLSEHLYTSGGYMSGRIPILNDARKIAIKNLGSASLSGVSLIFELSF